MQKLANKGGRTNRLTQPNGPTPGARKPGPSRVRWLLPLGTQKKNWSRVQPHHGPKTILTTTLKQRHPPVTSISSHKSVVLAATVCVSLNFGINLNPKHTDDDDDNDDPQKEGSLGQFKSPLPAAGDNGAFPPPTHRANPPWAIWARELQIRRHPTAGTSQGG